MHACRDILSALESIAPSRYALGFDKIGLQVGDPDSQVTRAVVAMDRSLGAVEYAIELGAQMLVTHHPLIFQPISSVDTRSHEGRTILRMIRAGINFAAAHTNWDAAKGGINDELALMFELESVSDFGMISEKCDEQHLGRVGTLKEPVSFQNFVERVETVLDTRSWTWGKPEKIVKRVAVVGGAADNEWMAAQKAGANVLLTGEVRQHVALEASESGMCIIAAGHFATEHPGSGALKNRLAEALPAIEWFLFTPPKGRHGRPH